jgi:hypothetical protein
MLQLGNKTCEEYNASTFRVDIPFCWVIPTFQRNILLPHLHGCSDLNLKMEVIFYSETLVPTSWFTLCHNVGSSILIVCLLIVIEIFRKEGLFVCLFVHLFQSICKQLFKVVIL